MTKAKQKSLNWQDAAELYRDVQKAMKTIQAKKASAEAGAQGQAASTESFVSPKGGYGSASIFKESAASRPPRSSSNIGTRSAVTLIIILACVRVMISAYEATKVVEAEATEIAPRTNAISMTTDSGPAFTKEKVEILTSLDKRRSELENRRERLDKREADVQKKEQELVTRLNELRELTDRLKQTRLQNEHKRTGQIEQLSNVYSSMGPNEAARLMEQLDITISLDLIKRMPEKRMAQILALMTPDKALQITKMLSETTKN